MFSRPRQKADASNNFSFLVFQFAIDAFTSNVQILTHPQTELKYYIILIVIRDVRKFPFGPQSHKISGFEWLC
jgi:hypothetical protein